MSTRGTRAMAGIAAAAVALGVTGLLAVFVGPEADARTAVGSAVIDLTPGPVKECAIQTFGMADKLVLSVLVLVVIAVVAALTAMWETRRIPIGSAAIVLAGVAGVCGGAVACRGDGRWTSCRRSSAPHAGSRCCACSRRDDSPRNPTSRMSQMFRIAVGGCRW